MRLSYLWRVAAVGLLLAMLLGPAAAEEASGPLTLAEAREMALTASDQVKLGEIRLEAARVALAEAEHAADEIPDGGSFREAQAKELSVAQATSGVVLAEAGLEYTRDQLALGVETAYYQVLLAESLVEVNEKAVGRAEEQLKLAQASYQAGIVARNDVLQAEAQVVSVRSALASAQKNLNLATMAFNQTLARPLDAPVELAGGLEAASIEGVDLEASMDQALAERFEILQAREGLANRQLAFKLAARYYTPQVFAYKKAEAELREAEVELRETQRDVELDVRTNYLELLDAQQRIAAAAKGVELAAENLRLARLRYEAGVGTNLDVLNAQVSVREAELKDSQALYDLNLAYAKYLKSTGR